MNAHERASLREFTPDDIRKAKWMPLSVRNRFADDLEAFYRGEVRRTDGTLARLEPETVHFAASITDKMPRSETWYRLVDVPSQQEPEDE